MSNSTIKIQKIKSSNNVVHEIDAKYWGNHSTDELAYINGEDIFSGGDINPQYIKIKYDDLVDLRNNGKLIPGRQYRITDYITTTSKVNTQSAGHQFDVIVTADTNNSLNEVARACLNENDNYFNRLGANLDAWQIWYCLDNDTDRFDWAYRGNGKGVIYRMIDEYNNDCPYDFKNIQFLRSVRTDGYGIILNDNSGYTIRQTYCYTFTWEDGTYQIHDASIIWNRLPYNEGETNGVHDNIIKSYTYGKYGYISTKQYLNDIVFYNIFYYDGNVFGGCYSNILENDCYNNTFGNGCRNNILGSSCYSNTFGNNCYSNTFGNNCYSNVFDGSCNTNTFGHGCRNNILGNSCYSNTFGNNCYSNTFGIGCYSNTFGNDCYSNTFGGACHTNTFGNRCYSNVFDGRCNSNTFGSGCHTNTFGNECTYNNLDSGCTYNIFDKSCYTNTFGLTCSNNKFGENCGINILDNNCGNNTFNEDCDNNILKNNCSANSLGDRNKNNNFGIGCRNIILGNDCYNNTFGNTNYDNILGIASNNNSFGNNCIGNTLDNTCNFNSFGNGCEKISLGNKCSNNNFGNKCTYISFRMVSKNIVFEGGESDRFIPNGDKIQNIKNVRFGDGCSDIVIYSNNSIDGESEYIRNINVSQGLFSDKTQMNDQRKLCVVPEFVEITTKNQKYETIVARNSYDIIKDFCLADFL